MRYLLPIFLIITACGRSPVECPIPEPQAYLIIYQELYGGSVSWRDTLLCERYVQWRVYSDRPFDDYDSALCVTRSSSDLYGGVGPGEVRMLGPNMRRVEDIIYFNIVRVYFPWQDPKSVTLFADSLSGKSKPDTVFAFVVNKL